MPLKMDAIEMPYARVPLGPYPVRRLPEGWESAPYERFRVTPLGPSIGAILDGVRLADPLDGELRAELERALCEFKVLVFRGQALSAAQHRAFAACWGELEAHPFLARGGRPEVVRFELGPDKGGAQNEWHSDVSFYERPTMGSVLRCLESPPLGGDTLWADMCTAYDLLPDEIKERSEGRKAVHFWGPAFGANMSPRRFAEFEERFPAQEHPIVRTHPVTGRRILYVNQTFTTAVVDMDPVESNELLAYLTTRPMIPELQLRWHWSPDDVVFWDNRATQHYALSDYHPHRRVMERLGIIGDKPI
jgi:taurine dioxygenase